MAGRHWCRHLTNTCLYEKGGTQNTKSEVSQEDPYAAEKKANAQKHASSEPPGLISRSTKLENFEHY